MPEEKTNPYPGASRRKLNARPCRNATPNFPKIREGKAPENARKQILPQNIEKETC
jgi:hypothetical protein